MHLALEIAGVEILVGDEGQRRHVLVLVAQLGGHRLDPEFRHVIEQTAAEIGDQVGAHGPAGAQIAEHPRQVGHAGEQNTAVRPAFGEVEHLAVDGHYDIAEHRHVEAGRGDNDVGLELAARFQQDAGLGERLDAIGHHRGLAGADFLVKIAVGDIRQTLAPRPVTRGEVGLDIEVLAEMMARGVEQLLLQPLGLLERAAGNLALIEEDFLANDVVDPFGGNIELAQHVGDFVAVRPGGEICR